LELEGLDALRLTALAATTAGLSYLLSASIHPAGSRDAGQTL
jgi:hypothetical protein